MFAVMKTFITDISASAAEISTLIFERLIPDFFHLKDY
jgi:hypothetical protein